MRKFLPIQRASWWQAMRGALSSSCSPASNCSRPDLHRGLAQCKTDLVLFGTRKKHNV